MTYILRATGVTRVFGHGPSAVEALKQVDVTIPRNCLVALRGRSGSGKTTLLNILGALDRPTSGSVYFVEDELTSMSEQERNEIRRTRMGFVFQSFALIPFLSAYENVEFGLRLAGVPKALWKERVEEALDWVGLTKRARHRPYEMSGGEQQRCAIARAMAHRPELILADEPTAELDSKMGRQVMGVFRQLSRELNISIVITTHDTASMEVADHLFALESGQVTLERTAGELA